MSSFSSIANNARNVLSEIDVIERNYNLMVERNAALIKALATIKTNLERSLKQPQNLNNAVYESINIARELTPYTNAGKTVVDPPLSDAEKILP